jgi:hypothetical protein
MSNTTELSRDSLFMVDSGGQYLDGTTDVTRTFHYGTPTQEQVVLLIMEIILGKTVKLQEKTYKKFLDPTPGYVLTITVSDSLSITISKNSVQLKCSAFFFHQKYAVERLRSAMEFCLKPLNQTNWRRKRIHISSRFAKTTVINLISEAVKRK